MNGLDTLISTASGAIGGGITGAIAAFVSWRTLKHTVKRDEFQAFFSSYKEDIANQEKSVAEAEEGPDKDERQRTLARLREEFHVAQEAWRQNQELAALVPRGAVSIDAPKLRPEQIAQLAKLLAGSIRLPAILLTADDYLTRGNAYYKAEDYQQALEAYSRALELTPDVPEALNNRGNALVKLERYEEAFRVYNHALELKPDYAEALSNRGGALTEMGRYDDALKDCSRALELKPDSAIAQIGRAHV